MLSKTQPYLIYLVLTIKHWCFYEHTFIFKKNFVILDRLSITRKSLIKILLQNTCKTFYFYNYNLHFFFFCMTDNYLFSLKT